MAVSPDGVAMLQIRGETHHACVETKTRVAEKTIHLAADARLAHGRIVLCAYDDVAFKRCVPREHRHQMLHQAFVANFGVGVYVVAMSNDEDGGSIVQIVVATITNSARALHRARLEAVTKPVLGWLYKEEIIERGYLRNEDFPSWVVDSNTSNIDESTSNESMDVKTILMSRCKLWYAFYKKLKGGRSGPGCIIPMPPLNLFKLASQFVYNKGKGGLDKATEQEARIRPRAKVSFESKYILRLMSAILINSWRCLQACTIVRPFLLNTPNPSVTELRRQLYRMTVEDFKFSFAKKLLKTLAIERNNFRNQPAALPNVVGTREDDEIANLILELRGTGKFPPYRHRSHLFNKNPLKRIRMHQSAACKHDSAPMMLGNLRSRKMCALCSSAKVQRSTHYQCSTCLVPLCCRALKGALANSATCFEKWHVCADIEREAKRRKTALETSRNSI
jgi:hypothetical protein